MKLSPKATQGHLVVGAILIVLALCSMLACMFFPSKLTAFLIFFFGVWGGIETGRYLEFFLSRNRNGKQTEQPLP
jgi:hypothetical protein